MKSKKALCHLIRMENFCMNKNISSPRGSHLTFCQINWRFTSSITSKLYDNFQTFSAPPALQKNWDMLMERCTTWTFNHQIHVRSMYWIKNKGSQFMAFVNAIKMQRKLNKILCEERIDKKGGNGNLQIEHVKMENWLTISRKPRFKISLKQWTKTRK